MHIIRVTNADVERNDQPAGGIGPSRLLHVLIGVGVGRTHVVLMFRLHWLSRLNYPGDHLARSYETELSFGDIGAVLFPEFLAGMNKVAVVPGYVS